MKAYTRIGRCFTLCGFLFACGDDAVGDHPSATDSRAHSVLSEGGTDNDSTVMPAQAAKLSAKTEPGDWQPLAPDALYLQRPLQDWVDLWIKWSNAQTNCDSAYSDTDGSQCSLYQDAESPVFFLQSGPPRVARTLCEVPSGKAILVPLVGIYSDDVGLPPPSRSPAAIEDEARKVIESARDLFLRYDNESAMEPLSDRTLGPFLTWYSLPDLPNIYSCNGLDVGEQRVEPVYAGGVFVLFPPPAAGVHTLVYGGTFTTPFGEDVRQRVSTTITVP